VKRSIELAFACAINKLPKQKSYNVELPSRAERQCEHEEFVRESIRADIARIHRESVKC
jgi:hypothetical protein